MNKTVRQLYLFNRNRTFFDRYSLTVLMAFAFLLPTVMLLAGNAVKSHSNKIKDWLPKNYPETRDLAEFRKHFAADQFVVVSWPGCKVGGDRYEPDSEPDDPRIEMLAQLLSEGVLPNPVIAERVSDVTDVENDLYRRELQSELPNFISSVKTARRTLEQMTSGVHGLPYKTAVLRLRGSLIGPDQTTSCVVVQLSDASLGKFREILGRPASGWLRVFQEEGLLFQAMRECGINPETAVIGGPPVDNVSIDEEGQRTLLRLAGLAGMLGLGLAWFSLRSIVLTAMVFACGIISAAASLALVALMGDHTDAIMFSMPPLVYVLAISGAVHLINYYRQSVLDDGFALAPEQSLKRGWKPALLCSITTALGLLSLCTSELVPIRKFGLYAAAGVLMMLVTLFLLLPAMLKLWPIRSFVVNEAQGIKNGFTSAVEHFWNRVGRFIIRRYVWVGLVFLLFMGWASWGLTYVKSSVDLMKLFGPEARILHDYHWMEENLGRLVPMEIVLRFDNRCIADPDRKTAEKSPGNKTQVELETMDRLVLVRNVQRLIEKRFGSRGSDIVGPSIAVTTFLPAVLDKGHNGPSRVRHSLMQASIDNHFDQLCESGYVFCDPVTQDELWRISLRLAAFRDVDYGKFVTDLRALIDPYVKKTVSHVHGIAEPVQVTYTGVIPIVYKAQRSLLTSLVSSTWWSFVTITPLLMLVSRGFLAGLVAMLPNVLPVLAIFGAMGWLGVPIDIGSMMAASIALGVAVDDTIHYLTWFRHELNRTGCRHLAILGAYRHCAAPTVQASMINGLALSVFAFSTFMPTRKFGYLMLTILAAGMVAELILLPALLASPLGRSFEAAMDKKELSRDKLPESQRSTENELIYRVDRNHLGHVRDAVASLQRSNVKSNHVSGR